MKRERQKEREYMTQDNSCVLQNDTRSFYQATLAEFMLRNPKIQTNSTTIKNVWKRD